MSFLNHWIIFQGFKMWVHLSSVLLSQIHVEDLIKLRHCQPNQDAGINKHSWEAGTFIEENQIYYVDIYPQIYLLDKFLLPGTVFFFHLIKCILLVPESHPEIVLNWHRCIPGMNIFISSPDNSNLRKRGQLLAQSSDSQMLQAQF